MVNNLIDLQRLIIKDYIKELKLGIDATLGNGNDTEFMIDSYENAKVLSFDIQKQAIISSKESIDKNKQKNIVFINDSHEHLDKYYLKYKEDCESKGENYYLPSLIMFNLGYLPKGDHNIKTTSYTTLLALDKSLKLLEKNGIVAIMFYVGHDNGQEYDSVLEYIRILDSKKFKAIHVNPINQNEYAPKLVLIQKID